MPDDTSVKCTERLVPRHEPPTGGAVERGSITFGPSALPAHGKPLFVDAAEHDRRVMELLEANNRLVEERRVLQGLLDHSRHCCDVLRTETEGADEVIDRLTRERDAAQRRAAELGTQLRAAFQSPAADLWHGFKADLHAILTGDARIGAEGARALDPQELLALARVMAGNARKWRRLADMVNDNEPEGANDPGRSSCAADRAVPGDVGVVREAAQAAPDWERFDVQ